MCASQHTPSDSGLKEAFSRSHNSKFPRLEKTNIQPNKSLDLKLLNIKKMLMHQNCKWRKHSSMACFSISRGTDILTTGSQAVQLFHSLFQLWILIKKNIFLITAMNVKIVLFDNVSWLFEPGRFDKHHKKRKKSALSCELLSHLLSWHLAWHFSYDHLVMSGLHY